jgi:hypothetical protein
MTQLIGSIRLALASVVCSGRRSAMSSSGESQGIRSLFHSTSCTFQSENRVMGPDLSDTRNVRLPACRLIFDQCVRGTRAHFREVHHAAARGIAAKNRRAKPGADYLIPSKSTFYEYVKAALLHRSAKNERITRVDPDDVNILEIPSAYLGHWPLRAPRALLFCD